MAEMEAIQLAQSVGSLLHTEHIVSWGEEAGANDNRLVEQSLTQLVEVTDSIYYAYVIKQQNGNITVIADSSSADFGTSLPTEHSYEKTEKINRLPFDTGQSLVAESISDSYGDWVRVLVPIYDSNKNSVVAALGLSYSEHEWSANLWKKMIPDIIVVTCLTALAFTLNNLLRENLKYNEAKQSRQESERSKSVFF